MWGIKGELYKFKYSQCDGILFSPRSVREGVVVIDEKL